MLWSHGHLTRRLWSHRHVHCDKLLLVPAPDEDTSAPAATDFAAYLYKGSTDSELQVRLQAWQLAAVWSLAFKHLHTEKAPNGPDASEFKLGADFPSDVERLTTQCGFSGSPLIQAFAPAQQPGSNPLFSQDTNWLILYAIESFTRGFLKIPSTHGAFSALVKGLMTSLDTCASVPPNTEPVLMLKLENPKEFGSTEPSFC